MSSYLVESFLPRARSGELPRLVERTRLASEALTAEGTPVRYVRSAFVPEDEVCLHFFEAPSIEAVRIAAERAELTPDRISEALDGSVASSPTPSTEAL